MMLCIDDLIVHFASYNEFTVADVSRLAPIKEQCPQHITYEQIKLVIAILHRRFGLQVDGDSTDTVLTTSAAVNLTNTAVASSQCQIFLTMNLIDSAVPYKFSLLEQFA